MQTSRPRSKSSSRRRRAASSGRSRFRSREPVASAEETASSPERRRRPATSVEAPAAPAGLADESRRVRPQPGLHALRRRRPHRRTRAHAACDGAGRVLEERTLDVDVPPGIHDGQRIRLSGEGHAGPVGGQSGDLYVLVRIRPHQRLVREGDHVYSTVDLTMTQAALGARGRADARRRRRARVRAGHAAGGSARPAGAGMPVLQGFGRGDHRVLVNVAVPRQLTEEQRNLLGEFERTATTRRTGPTRASSRS